ncbi:MAG: SPOR domain-containing protein [Terriglobia bacterium]
MVSRSEQARRPAGLSVRQLTLIFLGAVGVCSMFFALGFLVGSNRRPASSALNVEQVSPPGEIPPPVNPQAQSSPNTPSAPDQDLGGAPPVEEQNINPQAAPSRKSQSSEQPSGPAAVSRAAAESAAAPSRARAETPSGAQAAPGNLVLQVAALRTQREARSLVRRLRAHRFAAEVVKPQGAPAGRMYRVQVGRFSSRRAALAAEKKLRRAGFNSFVRRSR